MMKFLSYISILLIPITASSNTLKVQMGSAPTTFDWTARTSMVDSPIITNIQEGLFRFSTSERKLVPALAESVSISNDSKEYTFKINPQAKWSDGRPVFAQDFYYGWLKLLSPQSPSIYSYYLFGIQNAKEYSQRSAQASDIGINVIDDRTLKVTLKRAIKNWEYNTAFWPMFPVRKDLVEKHGENWWRAGLLVSTGPFTLESYDVGKKIILVKNKFALHPPKLEKIEISYSKDFDPIIEAFHSKSTDIVFDLPYSKATHLKKVTGLNKKEVLRLVYLGFNVSHFPFNHPAMRKTILHALEHSKLIPKEFSSARSMLPPQLSGKNADLTLKYDLKTSQNLLKKSGLVLGPKLKIQFLTLSKEPYWSVGKTIQEQIQKNLNINIELVALDSAELTTATNLGSYSMMVNSWTAKLYSPFDFLLQYSTDSPNNSLRYSSETFDALLFAAQIAKSNSEQLSILTKLQKFFMQDEAVYFPLFFDSNYYLVQKNVAHFNVDHMGNPDFSQTAKY